MGVYVCLVPKHNPSGRGQYASILSNTRGGMESRDDLDLAQTAALAPTPGEQNIGRGAENSLKRKERLKALREQRKRKLADGKYREIENEETEAVIASDGTEDQLKSGGKPIVGGNKLGGSVSLPKPVFRTYRPADDWLKKFELPDSQPENIDQQVGRDDTVCNEAKVGGDQ